MTQSFNLQDSLDELMKTLERFAGFPKYSLERRVDIFLVPFLEPFLKDHLGSEASFVAPEFPILSDLRLKGPDAKVGIDGLTRRTVNADYLFHLGRSGDANRQWLLVELKTDACSFDEDQADLYAIARLRKMVQLRTDLDFVREETDHPDKYQVLHQALARVEARTDEGLEIAYLAPEKLRDEACEHSFPRTARQRDMLPSLEPHQTVDHFLSLEALAALPTARVAAHERAAVFAPLWPTVQRLLNAVLAS